MKRIWTVCLIALLSISSLESVFTNLTLSKSFILYTYETACHSCRKPDLSDSFQLQRPIALSSSQAQDCPWAKLSFGNISTVFGV